MCQSGNFWTSSIIPEIRFTENLSDMKLQKFPHCVRGKGFVQSCHSIRYSDSLITVWKLRKLLSHFRQKFREVLISRNIFFVESKFRSFPHCADGPNSVERKTSRVTSCSLAFWGIVQIKILQPQSKIIGKCAKWPKKGPNFLPWGWYIRRLTVRVTLAFWAAWPISPTTWWCDELRTETLSMAIISSPLKRRPSRSAAPLGTIWPIETYNVKKVKKCWKLQH